MKFSLFFKVAWQSLCYRKGSVIITMLAIAVSVFTLLSTEHLRSATHKSFSSTVSGVDLIVGPRTSDINLLLTTVFRIGQPSHSMSWQSYQQLDAHNNIAWTIPISLGDSHKGYRVVGTSQQFFQHFQYGQSRALKFLSGSAFSQVNHVVLGAEVQKRLGYGLGDKLILSHGLAAQSFQKHTAHPFIVSGILDKTGTPVDNALYVSLAGMEAIHLPVGQSREAFVAQTIGQSEITPKSITAVMVGLSSKLSTFKVQRVIRNFKQEPLTAILPGVALTQLWQVSRGIENAMKLTSQLILLASLLGLCAMMVASLRERAYELSVFRTLGLSKLRIFLLIQSEAVLVALLGLGLGLLVFALAALYANDTVATTYGIDIGLNQMSTSQWLVLAYVLCGALVVATLPAVLGAGRAQG